MDFCVPIFILTWKKSLDLTNTCITATVTVYVILQEPAKYLCQLNGNDSPIPDSKKETASLEIWKTHFVSTFKHSEQSQSQFKLLPK